MKIFSLICILAVIARPVYAETVPEKLAKPMAIVDFRDKSPEVLAQLLKAEIIYRASLGRADDVIWLLEHGASANESNKEGIPALSLASARRDEESLAVVSALLKYGASINQQDKQGQNALFYAVRSGRLDMASLLLKNKIDYYAADKKGNIARNIALQMGKKDFAEMLDNFVKAETARVRKQYDDINTVVGKQYKQQEDDKLSAEERAQAELARQKAALEAEQAQIKQKQEKQNSVEFKRALETLAFNNCAFQYWSYVQATKQKSELENGALDDEIALYRQQLDSASQLLIDEYATYVPYIEMLSDKSKQLVFAQIDAMPSKIERFQQGIGKKEDMQTRCENISKHWKEMPLEKKKEQALPIAPGRSR